MRRARSVAVGGIAILLALTGCTGQDPDTAGSATDRASASAAASAVDSARAAVTGNVCPMAMDASEADYFPIQPSFSAGYSMTAQTLNDTTKDWAYVVSGDFPYSNWMAWYLYTTAGVPLVKLSDTTIQPDSGSTNPFVPGNKVLASPRSYHLYFMPSDTPTDVVSSMQAEGMNVALLPDQGSTPGVSIVSRSYWSFSNDDLGDYDRFGYGGPTDTPVHTITAVLTDPDTGAVTDTPVDDCGAQSELPEAIWYDPQTNRPIITFKDTDPPGGEEFKDLPRFLVQAGSGAGTVGAEFPPSPDPDQVAFYRNVAARTPYADISSAPPAGDPPDACGGYVMANLPNDVVSLVHIPQVPSFPDYTGATADTVNKSDDYNVAFYSVVIYGAKKQLAALGTVDNSQIGNTQITVNDDGSATVVLWPESASQDQVEQIKKAVDANGWNLLKSGYQTPVAPNLLVIREKGQNKQWKHALSANDVTQGAPCPQSTDPTLPLPQDPPDAAVTQFNGMGLTAPQGQNCAIDEFLSGTCLADLQARLKQDGATWSATGGWPTQVAP